MKIGIITQPLHTNYGGLLQNYALQQVLKKLGHDVITLDQIEQLPVPRLRIIASSIKIFILKMIGKGEKLKYPFQLDENKRAYISKHTRYFVDKYINHTPAMCKTADFRNFCINKGIDVLIAGSDQVWRPLYNNNIYRSFFDFAENIDIKRYAYAASFGVDCWEYTEEQTSKCKKLIESFDAISVREESAIELCNKYFNRKAEHVLDPTMLLDKVDYEALVYRENEPKSSGNLFTYILDESKEKTNIIEEVAKSLDLVLFKVMPKCRVNKKTIKRIDDCVFPPVTQWLRAFMDAEFVVCDSFHGAVFSIIFNKPFLIIGNKRRGLTRFYSLLKLYGLEDRIITDNEGDLSVINKNIDWTSVNSILNSMKNKSYMYLQQINQ